MEHIVYEAWWKNVKEGYMVRLQEQKDPGLVYYRRYHGRKLSQMRPEPDWDFLSVADFLDEFSFVQ
jgi:hypothetical protein